MFKTTEKNEATIPAPDGMGDTTPEIKTEEQLQYDLDERRTAAALQVGVQDLIAAELLAPPDGGTQAWMMVLGGHCVIFNSWFVQFHHLV